jgi:hypothetical protein
MADRSDKLTGALLDYWTARAIGVPAAELSIEQVPRTDSMICVRTTARGRERFAPSSDWSHGGPLIDEQNPTFTAHGDSTGKTVFADITYRGRVGSSCGDSHLEALCRTIVGSVYGYLVPDELRRE